MSLKNKILEKKYNYNIYRVIYNRIIYYKPQVLQVLIKEINNFYILLLYYYLYYRL
jgi:hypothetical protein